MGDEAFGLFSEEFKMGVSLRMHALISMLIVRRTTGWNRRISKDSSSNLKLK